MSAVSLHLAESSQQNVCEGISRKKYVRTAKRLISNRALKKVLQPFRDLGYRSGMPFTTDT